jgi:flagellar hook-basal body complex protein FliE
MSTPFAPIEGIKNTIAPMIEKPMTLDAPKDGAGSFSSVLANIMNTANDSQWTAGEMSEKLVTGSLKSTHEMSIAGAKAEVMLHLTTQIAAKLSSATTQLFQMQL